MPKSCVTAVMRSPFFSVDFQLIKKLIKNTLKKVCNNQKKSYICTQITTTKLLSLKDNKMNTSKITKGTKIESNKLVMVVTGETEKAFLGYHEYKGKVVGQCSISKDMFTNPHYMNNIKITNEA